MGRKDKNADDQQMEVSRFTGMMMTIFFAVLSLAFLFPIFLVFMNAFKSKLYISDAPFRFPVAEAYVGLGNYIEGVRKTGFFMAFGRSLFITDVYKRQSYNPLYGWFPPESPLQG